MLAPFVHRWRWSTTRILGLSMLFVISLISFQMYPRYGKGHISGRLFSQTLHPHHKTLVVSSMKSDNTLWLKQNLSDWNVNIYTVDDQWSQLTVPGNKGRESMVYLTYILDNYDNLPNVMVFIHGQRYQWHNDDPNFDAIPVLRNLQLDYVASKGYVNLRCSWLIGCEKPLIPGVDAGDDRPEQIHLVDAIPELFPDMPIPGKVAVGCCAQFAVSKQKVLERPRADYEHYRRWLISTDLKDKLSGRVLEYVWHMIFGMPAVYCPNAATCYCKTFGLCNLTCTESGCEKRYDVPLSTSDEEWPDNDWPGVSPFKDTV